MGIVPSSFDGLSIAFDVRGSGTPTLVFIHGLAGDRSDFDDQMTHFEQSHQVVALDLPGNGASGRGRQMWTIAAFGADVATVVDQLGLDDVVLVGHSLGGDVTVEAARGLGGRVRAVVWISSYRSLGAPQDREQIDRWLAPFREDFVAAADDLARRNFGPRADSALVERVAAKMCAADAAVVVQVLAAKMFNEPALLAGLGEITAHVVAINPDFKPNDHASFVASGVELVVMSDVGHFTMMEDPDAFNDVLASIIDQHGPT